METNQNTESNENHQVILRLVTGLFRGPYLSFGLISFLALVVLTDYAYVLMREPIVYWLDHSREAVRSLGGFKYGPLVALALYAIYIVLLSGILRLLNRRISIVLWSGFLIWHLSTFIWYPPSCRFDMLTIIPVWLCRWSSDVVAIMIGLLVGIVLSKNFYSPVNTTGEPEGQGSFLATLGLSKLGATLSVLWLLLLGVGIALASHVPTTGWRPLVTAHTPSPRYGMMVAYDTKNNEAIVFGGTIQSSPGNWTKINETWVWDGQDWTQMTPENSPPARSSGGLAYDPKRDVTILFGGWNNLDKGLNDTWQWDGTTWTEVGNCATCVPPPARGCENMFYDSTREQIIMYGGCNEYKTFFNDAWGWNGQSWEWIDMGDSPIASGAPMIYDPVSQWAVGFLAWEPSGTWIWDKSGWTKPALEAEPPLRGNSMLANDATTGNSLLFGGIKVENNYTTFYTDTWFLNGKTWSEVKETVTPPGRWGHIIFFDKGRNQFMMFGGFDGTSALNDLWEINLSTAKEK